MDHQSFPAGPVTGEPVSFVTTVTPDLAAGWLADRLANRKISVRHRDAIARDIAAGNFHLTHQGIAFTWDESRWRLSDGQHRMAAVLLTERTIRIVATFGANVSGVDITNKRQFGHQLSIESVQWGSHLSAVLKLITIWEMWGQPPMKGNTYTPTWDEMRKTLDVHPCIADAMPLIDRVRRGCGLRTSVGGWFRYATAHSNGRECVSPDDDWFLTRLIEGDGLPAGHPILTLRNRIASDREFRGNEMRLAAGCVYAWNAYREGREMSTIRLPATLTPSTFPETQ